MTLCLCEINVAAPFKRYDRQSTFVLDAYITFIYLD